MEISIAFIVSAFIAGILMFLAPCTLPMVPAYLAFISGVKQSDVDGTKKGTDAKRRIIKNAIAFILGFSIIFVAFGILAGLFGTFIGQFRVILTQVGGVFIIIFGLMMLNVINFAPLMKDRKLSMPSSLKPGKPTSAFLIGATFALGWTPCVGPVLASVLLLASTSTTVLSGGFLLGVFSLGLAVPFLLTAFLYAHASETILRYGSITKWVSIVGGVFLIFIGGLLLTDNFGLTVEYGYKVFNFFGFEGLFDLY
ncbi:cytochrome c biogenesis protein CcdA [Candidatus Pacebacteria bacterium]|nr:cytochrome c biogenesis protein CcdA [Candidatus Paceibacterota bacterium]